MDIALQYCSVHVCVYWQPEGERSLYVLYSALFCFSGFMSGLIIASSPGRFFSDITVVEKWAWGTL